MRWSDAKVQRLENFIGDLATAVRIIRRQEDERKQREAEQERKTREAEQLRKDIEEEEKR